MRIHRNPYQGETMDEITVYLALGSNLGDRRNNLIDAINQLRQKVRIDRLSSVYETEPAYVTDQPPFLNMVVRGTTTLSPQELLQFLKSIERRMGRFSDVRYGPRPIDIDILLYGDVQIREPDLCIPHPRMLERAFVLIPLAEIAPDLKIPGQTATVAELAQQVQGVGKVIRVERGLRIRLQRDVQNEAPMVRIRLTHVGVTGIRRVVRLKGEFGDELFEAEMDLYVELRPDQKGVHMSRFSDTIEEIFSDIPIETAPTLERLAERIARQLLQDQRTVRSDVRIRARFPLERYAPVSGKPSQEIYTLIGMAAVTPDRAVRFIGVEAEGMMACPCAQDMVATYTRERLREAGYDPEEIERILNLVPIATHNQRGKGMLLIGTEQTIDARDLISIVEGAMSSENYDLLKRPDELFVVAKAHRRPRFVEDAVREMLYSVVEQFPHLDTHDFVLARQTNLETIHKHDVYAERAATIGDLRRELSDPHFIPPLTTLETWLRERLGR